MHAAEQEDNAVWRFHVRMKQSDMIIVKKLGQKYNLLDPLLVHAKIAKNTKYANCVLVNDDNMASIIQRVSTQLLVTGELKFLHWIYI